MNLYQASSQWSTRPADERFWSLEDMLTQCRSHKESSHEKLIRVQDVRIEPQGTQMALVGKAGVPAHLTNWSFGQVATFAGAPADYLRKCSPKLAADCLNEGLRRRDEQFGNLLIHKNGSLVARSFTSDSYSRVWDCELIESLQRLESQGWRVPPARPAMANQPGTRVATEADVMDVKGNSGLCINVGDLIAPAGLYASDHDMFVFMVNESRRIQDGSDGGLSRGFFLSNSEVANFKSLKLTAFLYRHVCGNHIVWDASQVCEVKVHHKGENPMQRFREQFHKVQQYAELAASKDEARIIAASRLKLGQHKEDVLDTLYKHLRGELSQKLIESCYDKAVADREQGDNFDPRTAWGWAMGASSYSQSSPFADERNRIDKAGAKIIALAV